MVMVMVMFMLGMAMGVIPRTVRVAMAPENDEANQVRRKTDAPDYADELGVLDRGWVQETGERLEHDGDAEGDEEDGVEEGAEDLGAEQPEGVLVGLLLVRRFDRP